MKHRHFLAVSSGTLLTLAVNPRGFAKSEGSDAAWYRKERRFAELPLSRVAYVERGRGPGALFIHGWPLNGYQWRGVLDRSHQHRRCVAPDLMGMGFTETPEGQTISPATQATMLAQLLDKLQIDAVDLVANDSGGLVAQLFLAKYPERVRTLLLTNCDVDENSPPPALLPLIEMSKKGTLVDEFIVPQLKDKEFARSAKAIGGFYTHPERLTDETLETYFRPFVETPLRKAQLSQFTISMETNPLLEIREELRRWKGPARMVWGLKDPVFPVKWAEWLDRTLPGSRGVRKVEGANLFFPEEMPELIAEEARRLWLEETKTEKNA